MKWSLVLSSIFVIICSQASAGDGEYAVSKISPELIKSANAVKRMEEIRFEVLDVGRAVLRHKYVITVLNENGNKYAALQEYYDKLRTIESIDGDLYDANGKKIRSLKKSDVRDVSGTDDNNLADDNRIKYHNFYQKVYPYTVAYEVEFRFNYTMFFPIWDPIEDELYSVEESKIEVVCPAEYKFRFKAFNYPGPPTEASEKSHKTYTWEVKNLKPVKWEYALPEWSEVAPMVFLAPEQFEIEGYKGNMQNWQDFGKFVYALKAGKDQLPDDIKQRVHQICEEVTDTRQKIATLYEFMQQNTRYVSVQLGIGGWQPFDATYVSSKKYGDCKALANYMYSLLKEAGVKSYYTLVKAGVNARNLVDDFASSQFNHVILCVPLQQDTVWLECTSQTLPAGYLSGFTEDRSALLIDETGGKLVRTPRYGFTENLQTRAINADIDDEGMLNIKCKTFYRAMQQDDLEDLVSRQSRDKLSDILKSGIGLPTYDLVKFDYYLEKSKIPVVTEYLEIKAPNYAQVTGKRMFINPNILNQSNKRLEIEEDRKYSINLKSEFRDIDSSVIHVPSGFIPESIPTDINIKTVFGQYIRTTKFQGDKITYYRLREQYAGKFEAKEYVNLVAFYERIFKADHAQLVLVKR